MFAAPSTSSARILPLNAPEPAPGHPADLAHRRSLGTPIAALTGPSAVSAGGLRHARNLEKKGHPCMSDAHARVALYIRAVTIDRERLLTGYAARSIGGHTCAVFADLGGSRRRYDLNAALTDAQPAGSPSCWCTR